MTVADREPGGGVPGALAAWLSRLGPLAIARPDPSLGRTLAGTGGALAALGVVTLVGDRWASSGSAILAIVLLAALLAGSVAAMVRMPPPVGVAGVAASGIAAPALAFFLMAGGGFPSLREVAVVGGLFVAGLYLVGPGRGHTFHLSILVVAGWLFALSLSDVAISRPGSGAFGTLGDVISGAGAASMVAGVVYLGLGSWLHDEGLQGMATPFLAVAALALPVGALAVLRDSPSALQGVVAMATGAAVALVGARCRRRGSTWIGVAAGAVGVLVLADGLSDRTAVVALVLALAGAGLVLVAPMAAALAGEPPAADPPPAGGPAPEVHADAPDPPPETPAPRARRDRPTRPPHVPRTPLGGPTPAPPPATADGADLPPAPRRDRVRRPPKAPPGAPRPPGREP